MSTNNLILSPATFLVFKPRPARARVISPGCSFIQTALLKELPSDIPLFPFSSQSLKLRIRIFKKHFIAQAKLTLVFNQSLPGTRAITIIEPIAFLTIFREFVFSSAKGNLFFRIQKLYQALSLDIAQFPFWLHIEIAGIYLAVMLHYNIVSAFLEQSAFWGLESYIMIK